MTSPMMLQKILATLVLTVIALLIPQLALAQQTTLIPGTSDNFEIHQQRYDDLSVDKKEELRKSGIRNACGYFLANQYKRHAETGEEDLQSYVAKLPQDIKQDILSCSIKTGKVHLWMLALFITGIVNFLIYIAGTIAVLFTLLGGFWYMTGGLTDDKEKGKKTITYALMGLVITLLAWIIVNIIMVQVTG